MKEDPDLTRVKNAWQFLTEKQRKAMYREFCFLVWRERGWFAMPHMPTTRWDIVIGAWLHYTKPIYNAWDDLNLYDEDRAVLIAGFLIGIFYLLMLIARLG